MTPLRRRIALAWLLLFTACNSTVGNLFEAPFAVGGVARDAGGPLVFTTLLGWQVTLTQAKIAVGPFYFNIQPPETATLRSGVVIYQVISQIVVDPLDPTLYAVDGGGDGITGHAVAVEIDLLPPDSSQSPQDQELLNQASTSFISGTAIMPLDGGMEVVPFEGLITINQSLANNENPLPALQRINGAVCDLTFSTAPSAAQLRVDPTHWFDTADFSSLLPHTDGGPPPPLPDGGTYTWNIQSTFHSEVLSGIQSLSGVYAFSVVDAGQ
jgi:hypothetical protein